MPRAPSSWSSHFIEVEIFNRQIWDTPVADVVHRTAEAFGAAVAPHLAAAAVSRAS